MVRENGFRRGFLQEIDNFSSAAQVILSFPNSELAENSMAVFWSERLATRNLSSEHGAKYW
jgi:hypothetical protein